MGLVSDFNAETLAGMDEHGGVRSSEKRSVK